jgi:hypothetical protein
MRSSSSKKRNQPLRVDRVTSGQPGLLGLQALKARVRDPAKRSGHPGSESQGLREVKEKLM